MNSQPFNRWRDRFLYGIDAVERGGAETGEAKGHFFNVTANSTDRGAAAAGVHRLAGQPLHHVRLPHGGLRRLGRRVPGPASSA